MNNYRESNILEDTLDRFVQITGAKVKLVSREITKKQVTIDAVVQITAGKEKHEFYVEAKNELRQVNVPAIIEQFGKEKDNWLLVARYIPQPLKTRLKELNINYVEEAGNCFIQAGGLYMYINDRPVTKARQTPAGKLWKPAGLKFLFAIISKPALINESYRAVADAAGIALGNIGPLLEELQQAGYTKETANGWELLNKESLIQRWVELFQVLLKPKLKQGHFRFLDPGLRQKWKTMKPVNFYWGGEPAGELLTDYLQPELFIIYTGAETTALMKQLKLVPDAKGEIELVKQFWNQSLVENKSIPGVVPPLLAYADLMDSNDSRNWETAERIKKEYLQND